MHRLRIETTNVGFMLVILSPDFALTNSLSMKIPVGKVNFLPLGAVRSIERSDILRVARMEGRLEGNTDFIETVCIGLKRNVVRANIYDPAELLLQEYFTLFRAPLTHALLGALSG